MKHLLLILSVCCPLSAHARQMTSDAVIMRNDASFTVTDKTHATYRHTIEIMVTEKGKSHASFSCSVNNGSTKLKSFSGEIKDATGKVTKIKKSDLRFTEYSEGLADSYMTWYYSPSIVHYPAKVTYTFEKQYSDAILGYDPFVPLQLGEGVMAMESSYRLEVPQGTRFNYKQLNLQGVDPERSTAKDSEVYVWRTGPIHALEAEKDSPPLTVRMPVVLFSPEEFSYEKKDGSNSDWKAVGDWLLSLTDGMDTPPADLQAKVSQLTEGAKDDLEKIRRLYEYLGETTRYVSIQLGLGGLRPIAPEDVFRNKFGDCKAMSFYMQTMLKCCGIESHYVITNMGEDKLIPDFPSLGTTNHAIVAVPMAKDTLWLECTNPEVPLGYVHPGIAGNRALVVKKGGSYVTRLPKAKDMANLDSTGTTVDLNPDGSAVIHANEKAEMNFWMDLYSLTKMSESERINEIMSRINLPRVTISDVKILPDPSPEPSCLMTYKAEASTYASVTGSRLFVPVNPFRSISGGTTSAKRINDLYFKDGYVLADAMVLNVPEGYSVEAYPDDFEFENEFGAVRFKQTSKRIDGHLRFQYWFRFEKKSGTFQSSSYDNFRSFMRAAESIYYSKLVLVKK